MASVDQGDRNSRFSGSKTLFLLIFRPKVLYCY